MEAIRFSQLSALKKETKIREIPIEKIRPNPYQPRKYFNRSNLEELASSILEYGVLQPIIIRKNGSVNYELIAGERRLRASELAGLTTIPAIILNVNDNDSALMAFVENIQRQNLNFLEEAEGYKCIMEDYGFTQEELANKLSKSQSAIANKLRILKLSDKVKKLIIDHNLTERHARAVLKLPQEASQIEAVTRIIKEDLTVKKTEEMVADMMEVLSASSTRRVEKKEKRMVNNMKLFTNSIRQSVDIIRKTGIDVTYENIQEGDFCEIIIKIKGYPEAQQDTKQEVEVSHENRDEVQPVSKIEVPPDSKNESQMELQSKVTLEGMQLEQLSENSTKKEPITVPQ